MLTRDVDLKKRKNVLFWLKKGVGFKRAALNCLAENNMTGVDICSRFAKAHFNDCFIVLTEQDNDLIKKARNSMELIWLVERIDL